MAVEQKVNELDENSPPSDVRIYDLNHNYLRTEPATFFEGTDKLRNYQHRPPNQILGVQSEIRYNKLDEDGKAQVAELEGMMT